MARRCLTASFASGIAIDKVAGIAKPLVQLQIDDVQGLADEPNTAVRAAIVTTRIP